jgi:hypothetical protein
VLGHDIHTYYVRLRELLSQLRAPAAGSTADVEDVARLAHRRHEIALEHVAQHVVLQLEPITDNGPESPSAVARE